MPVDKEKVKKALDDFQNDDFVSAKETLKPEIKKAKEEFIQKKLGLKEPITPEPEAKGDDDKGKGDDDKKE